MSQEDRLINGELLRSRRETQGWAITDMASRACLSTKQVRQLEEGGTSAFYNESVKLTAAKKVGGLLGLSADEVFVSSVTAAVEPPVAETPVAAPVAQDPAVETEVAPTPTSTPEPIDAPVSTAAAMTTPSELPAQEEAKPKTSIWAIAGLFAGALAVAAYMQPKEETPLDPAPPLQAVPSEPDAAASAAEAAASAASTPVDAAAQKAASSPAVSASSPAPAASMSAAPSAVRASVNAASGVTPAAPAASKAP